MMNNKKGIGAVIAIVSIVVMFGLIVLYFDLNHNKSSLPIYISDIESFVDVKKDGNVYTVIFVHKNDTTSSIADTIKWEDHPINIPPASPLKRDIFIYFFSENEWAVGGDDASPWDSLGIYHNGPANVRILSEDNRTRFTHSPGYDFAGYIEDFYPGDSPFKSMMRITESGILFKESPKSMPKLIYPVKDEGRIRKIDKISYSSGFIEWKESDQKSYVLINNTKKHIVDTIVSISTPEPFFITQSGEIVVLDHFRRAFHYGPSEFSFIGGYYDFEKKIWLCFRKVFSEGRPPRL